jgi:hypothetical protein
MKALNKRYFGNEKGPTKDNFVEGCVKLSGDAGYAVDVHAFTTKVASKAKSPVYQYIYTHAGSLTMAETFGIGTWRLIVKVR